MADVTDMANANTAAHTSADAHHGLAHVVPMKLLFGVFGALIVLTWITVAVTWVDLGPANLLIALFIALIKGVLVCLYFMHLRWEKPFNLLVFLGCLCFAVLFISFALIDTRQYRPSVIPGQAPNVPPPTFQPPAEKPAH